MRRGYLTLIIATTVLGFVAPLIAKFHPCTQEEAMKAENAALDLNSWTEVFDSYRRYGHCDDGAIAEGYSDSVARLLSDNWPKVQELNRLCAHHESFERFVLRHVDELMSIDQARRIREQAKTQCPKEASRLCKAIIKRIDAFPKPRAGQHGTSPR